MKNKLLIQIFMDIGYQKKIKYKIQMIIIKSKMSKYKSKEMHNYIDKYKNIRIYNIGKGFIN